MWRGLWTAAVVACLGLATGVHGATGPASAPIDAAGEMPRLRVEGKKIVDPAGKQVVLRGVNLGNWLLIEPGGLGGSVGRFPDQHTLFSVLGERFGEAERRRLIGVYRDHYITERDFELAKQFQFNLLRVGFDYELLEDDARPQQLRADAFKYLDFAVDMAGKQGMYVLLDLHGAQERQVDGKQSGRVKYNRFWDDRAAQERSLWMWEQIARRYKGRTNVLGYEALNEPWGKSKAALRDYCRRWYERLRPIDPEAVLVFPGWWNDVTFYGRPEDSGWSNVMFDMHFYPGNFNWGKPGIEVNREFLTRGLAKWVATMDELNAPLLVGEFNVVHKRSGGGEMTRRYYDVFAQHGWPVTFWTLKELRRDGGMHEGMWMLVTNRDPMPPLDIRTSSAAEIEAFFRSLSTMPLVADEDVRHWLTTDASPGPLPATIPSTVPSGGR